MRRSLHGASESVLTGGVVVRRDELSIDHPESWPSLWLKTFGDMKSFPYYAFDIYGGHFLIDCAHCHEDMEKGLLNSEDVQLQ